MLLRERRSAHEETAVAVLLRRQSGDLDEVVGGTCIARLPTLAQSVSEIDLCLGTPVGRVETRGNLFGLLKMGHRTIPASAGPFEQAEPMVAAAEYGRARSEHDDVVRTAGEQRYQLLSEVLILRRCRNAGEERVCAEPKCVSPDAAAIGADRPPYDPYALGYPTRLRARERPKATATPIRRSPGPSSPERTNFLGESSLLKADHEALQELCAARLLMKFLPSQLSAAGELLGRRKIAAQRCERGAKRH